MRDAMLAVYNYLTEEVDPDVSRLAKRLTEIGTAWGVSIPAPVHIGIGFSRDDQFPSVAILPQRVDQQQETTGGFPGIGRLHSVTMGVACGDVDDAVVVDQVLAYNKAVQGLINEDETLGDRVSDCSFVSSDFSDVASEDRFYRTIDIGLVVRLKPSTSETI